MSYRCLHVQSSEAVFTITLDRPKANAFNFDLAEDLLKALGEARRDPAIRCVVLTGAGRFFSGGQDIPVILEQGEHVPYRDHLRRTYNAIVLALREMEKPVIGAINGPAAGAGLGIALATDIRWASESAEFIFGFSAIGLAVDSGVSLMLPQVVGLAKASEMAFTNDALDAHEALEWGIVTRVVQERELLEEVFSLAARIASGPTLALGLTKRAFNRAILPNLPAMLEYEANLQEVAGASLDHKEGLAAFIEKRPGKFSGR